MSSEQLKNIIDTRAAIIKNLLFKSKKYFDTISDIIMREDPPQYAEFIRLYENAGKIAADVSETAAGYNKDDPAGAFDIIASIYQRYYVIEDYIALITVIFSNRVYFAKMAISMSQTFLSGVQLYKTETFNQIKYYIDDLKKPDMIFFQAFAATPDIKKITLEKIPAEFARGHFNKFLIFMVNHIYPELDSAERATLAKLIKGTKANIIGSAALNPDDIKEIHPQQQYAIAGELIPQTDFMKYSDIIAAAESSGYKLDSDFKSSEISTVIIRKDIGTPYEYRLRPLIEATDAKPNFALNKQFIKRMNTISAPPNTTNNAPAAVIKNLIGKPSMDTKFIIIEIWGESARILGSGSNSIKGNKLITTYADCRHLFTINTTYIKYNNIIAQNTHHEDRKYESVILQYEEEQNKTLDYSQLKERLREDILKYVQSQLQLLGKKLDNETAREFIANVSPTFEDIIYNTFKKIHSGSLISKDPEFIISRMNKVQMISGKYMREFRNKWIGATIKYTGGGSDEMALLAVVDKINREIIEQFDTGKMWNQYDITVKEIYMQSKLL